MKTSVNTAEVYTKYYIGKYIVEYEQEGNVRAQYGEQLLKDLSKKLTLRYGAGWSYTNLKYIRKFYTVYSKRSTTGCPFENKKANQWLANSKDSDNQMFKLSWSHASAYQLYLPDKALLQAKVREWIAEFEENNIEE